MGLRDAIRRRLHADSGSTRAATLLTRGEALLRAGGPAAELHRLGQRALRQLEAADALHNDEQLAQLAAAHLLSGDLAEAAKFARAAAEARPYDVDSRIIHGNVRLARHELTEAAHEFDAVIEEFGAERDAAAGRRAVILARGEGPHDELAASDDDWREAATLLAALWDICGLTGERVEALSQAHSETLMLIEDAVSRRPREEESDGTV